MYWRNYFMVHILVCLQKVSSQVSISYDEVPVECGKQLILKCTYTGGTNCCSSSTRYWFKNGNQILSDGASTPEGKYSEIIDASNNQFSLVINHIGNSDFEQKYECSYSLTTSSGFILKDTGSFFHCSPNEKCGGTCFGFSIIGVVLAVLIGIVIVFCARRSKEDLAREPITNKIKIYGTVGIITFIPSILWSCIPIICTCTWPWYICYGNYQLLSIWFVVGFIFSLMFLLCPLCLFKQKLGLVRVKNEDIKDDEIPLICHVSTLGTTKIASQLLKSGEKKAAAV